MWQHCTQVIHGDGTAAGTKNCRNDIPRVLWAIEWNVCPRDHINGGMAISGGRDGVFVLRLQKTAYMPIPRNDEDQMTIEKS